MRHPDGNHCKPMPTPKPALLQIRPSIGQGIIVIITYNHQGVPALLRRCFLTGVILSDHGSQGTGCSSQSWRRLRSCKSLENSALSSAFWTILVFFHGGKMLWNCFFLRKPLTCPWYPPGTQLVHFFGHQEYLLYHPGSWNNRNSMVYRRAIPSKTPNFQNFKVMSPDACNNWEKMSWESLF